MLLCRDFLNITKKRLAAKKKRLKMKNLMRRKKRIKVLRVKQILKIMHLMQVKVKLTNQHACHSSLVLLKPIQLGHLLRNQRIQSQAQSLLCLWKLPRQQIYQLQRRSLKRWWRHLRFCNFQELWRKLLPINLRELKRWV